MSRAEANWERLVRAALRGERVGAAATAAHPVTGIAGIVPSCLANNEHIEEILRVFTAAKEGYPIRESNTYEQPNSIESCQKNCEAAKRPELMVQEDNHLHEAEGVGSEQECDDYRQMEINRRPEIALSKSASKPEELLKLLAARPLPPKPAHNGSNAYTAPAETGSIIKAVEDTTHKSEKRKQCKNSSLHMLPAQKKGEEGAESETAKEEESELQQVEEGNVSEAISIKESTTVAPLIVTLDPSHMVRNKNSCSQFARKEQDHKFITTLKVMELKAYALVLEINWLKENRQVVFDPGPNEVTTHSIKGVRQDHNIWVKLRELRLEGVDLVLRPDYLKTYRQVPFDPGPNKVTFCSIEGEVSHRSIMTSKLQKVIHQKTQGMLGQSAMIRIEEMAKAITTEGCKRVNSLGLAGIVEGLNNHIQKGQWKYIRRELRTQRSKCYFETLTWKKLALRTAW
uniref:Uncharacterized protein n=1 Tax=Ananas comosus var. bracteatus TaxID=296719 RepID=A0A6V7PWL3_ANACO|nr:unnamed protein product [Ananas comosus var. bracteatus]